MAYDHLDSLFERSLAGTLEMDGGSLKFRAINREVSWNVSLEDIASIKIEEVMNPLKVRVKSIVINSREGDGVRRRIAPIDGQLQFMQPVVLSALIKERLKKFSEQRTLATPQY